ncbi:MAG: DUF6492 family protein [Candidatus Dependentiae bacterium]|nr:DUF6492 family protein [Candidatus Dependentiae bacterium]
MKLTEHYMLPKALLISFFYYSISLHAAETIKTIYHFSNEPIDVVIPCHEKDVRTLDLAIKGIRENGKNIGEIFVISAKQLTHLAKWVPEKIFPFSKNDLVPEIAHFDQERIRELLPCYWLGWIYQQLLKLYAPFIIRGISSNVLIVDADVIFLNETEFMDAAGNPYFNYGTEGYHAEYFEHAAKLIDEPFSIKRVFPEIPGICHHMLMQKVVLQDLFEKIEKKHVLPAWKALCRCINWEHIQHSCMSEYEIYFNFIFSRTDQAKLRFLKYDDLAYHDGIEKQYKKLGYSYIACHSWK